MGRFLPILFFLLAAAAGYLLGSVNWAIIFTRLFKNKEDIRKQGSGNAGMTNVLRSVGKLPALLTFVGDFLKCVAAVALAGLLLQLGGLEGNVLLAGKYAAGLACVLGHMFPVFYGFQGGKGIVTSAAMILMTDWRIFLLILATFGIVFLWKKIISLGSVAAAALYPVYTFLVTFFLDCRRGLQPGSWAAFTTVQALLLGLLVLWKHRANIGRLLRGEEKPIHSKK